MSETEIREIFIGEAREIFENLESDIIKLEENTEDSEIINRVFRYVHTIKGSSGIAGFNSIYDFTHKLENLLDDVRSGDLKVENKLIDLILNSIDWIKNEIFLDEKENINSKTISDSLLSRIAEFKGEDNIETTSATSQPLKSEIPKEPEEDSKDKYYNIKVFFNEDIFESGIDPLMIIEDLLSLGTLIVKRVNRDKLATAKDFNPEKCYMGWDLLLKSEESIDKINNVFMFVSDDNEIDVKDVTSDFREVSDNKKIDQEKKVGEIMVAKGMISEDELEEVVEFQDSQKNKIGDILIKKGLASEDDVQEALKEQEKLKKKIEISTVRVDTGKLDNLLNLLGEIVIGQAGLSGLAEALGDNNEIGFQLTNALFGLERITREFQEQIMSIRMIPIGPSFEQFRRFVRDSAQAHNKNIKLIIEGGETELDKTVIERIADPLKHMIRNSIDHGIEFPEERKSTGKKVYGTIILKAYHQEGNIYIEVNDDGKGIDVEKIKVKAIEKGLIKPDEEISKEKLLLYLFYPGFSTAEKIGDLSGRGVGMDVVKTNIEDLRGTVEIKSDLGKGTVLRIKLPLTLAIIDGMLVRVGKNIYIIPLLSVVESIQPQQSDIKTIEGKGEVVLVRGEYISLIRLYEMFGIDANFTNPWDGLIVIVESGSTSVGLFIDDLVGQQQIVIKSLESYITKSRAISGATILGDGKVALILDIHGLIEDMNQE